MGSGQRAGEDGRHLARPVDGDIERQVRRRQRRRGADEVVHGVAVPGDERGPGVGDAAGMVRLQDGLGGGQPRAHRLGPTAEAGEEVGLDEAGDDADVGLHVLALQQHRRPVHLSDAHVPRSARVVVDDPVAGHEVGADQLRHLGRGGLAVRPGGAQQRDVRRRAPRARASSARSGGSTVRFGMGRVRSGKTTATRPPRRPARPAAGRRAGGERGGDRRRLVVERRQVDRHDDLGARRVPRPTSRCGRRRGRRARRSARGCSRSPGATRSRPAPPRRRSRPAAAGRGRARRSRGPARSPPPRGRAGRASGPCRAPCRPAARPGRGGLARAAARQPASRGRKSGPRPTPAGPSPAPPSATPSAVAPPRRPTVTTSMTRRTSQATDSTTARARSLGAVGGARPMNPPGRRRATTGRGRRRATAPPPRPRARRALGGQAASSSGCGRAGGPARPGTCRRQTARPRAASPRPPPGSPRRPAGDGTGRSCTGTETLAVVPQLTMGRSSDAPEPSTSHWRSPAPMTTGIPGRSPSSAPCTGLSWPTTVSEARCSGAAQRGPGQPRTALPSKS